MKVFACTTDCAIWFSSVELHPMWYQITPPRLFAWREKMEVDHSYEEAIKLFHHLPHLEFEVSREEEIIPMVKQNFLEMWL